jgi:uncharacterized protein
MSDMSESQLLAAVKADDIADVRRLLDGGADINQQDEQGWTPLNWAAGKGSLPLVSLLLERGADIFKVGRDLRTPYMIALAAGHADVARLLRDAEDRAEGEKPDRPERKYCKAYHLEELRSFAGWTESRINWKHAPAGDHGANGNGNGASASANGSDAGQAADADADADADIVFLHQDYTVTQSMWEDENVIFNQVTPEWVQFCTESLKFKVPDDLDLLVPAEDGSDGHPPNAAGQ